MMFSYDNIKELNNVDVYLGYFPLVIKYGKPINPIYQQQKEGKSKLKYVRFPQKHIRSVRCLIGFFTKFITALSFVCSVRVLALRIDFFEVFGNVDINPGGFGLES